MNESSDQNEVRGLVPITSARTKTVIITVSVLALLVAWFLPGWAYPQLAPPNGGVIATMVGTPFALTGTDLPDGQKEAVLRGINDIAGATVVGAWVTRADETDFSVRIAWDTLSQSAVCDDDNNCHVPSGTWVPVDASELLEALSGVGARVHDNELPHSVKAGDRIWVLWQITDCSVAHFASPSQVTHEFSDPLMGVQMSGLLGLVSRQQYILMTPFNLDSDWLYENGFCSF